MPSANPEPVTDAEVPGAPAPGVALVRWILCAYADVGTRPAANRHKDPRLRSARDVTDERILVDKMLRVREKDKRDLKNCRIIAFPS